MCRWPAGSSSPRRGGQKNRDGNSHPYLLNRKNTTGQRLPCPKNALQTIPGSEVFSQFTQLLECLLKVVSIESAVMPSGDADGVEQVFVAAGKHLEEDQVFRT